MSKKLIVDLVKFCNEVKEVLIKNDEKDFRQLKLRDREKIINRFKEMFKTEYDDGCIILDINHYRESLTPDLHDHLVEIALSESCFTLTFDRHKDTIEKIDSFLKLIQEISKKTITLLNCAIITSEGNYSLKKTTLEEVKELIEYVEIQSAIGHRATAEILTELLGTNVPMNRIQYEQQTGEIAIVFKLKSRIPEGKILTREEIEQIGYEFCILERTK